MAESFIESMRGKQTLDELVAIESSRVIGDLVNDYNTADNEQIDYHRIITSKGVEDLLIHKIIRGRNVTTLRYDGRQIIKVLYTNPDGKFIKQAFYRSTGAHLRAQSYAESKDNIDTSGTWVPFDGIGYHDEQGLVAIKRDLNRDWMSHFKNEWLNRGTMLYKCDYFGKKTAVDFAEPVDPKYPVHERIADNKEWNKNYDLVRYGDENTLRISFLLSSGDPELPNFWKSPLGQRIIQKYEFDVDPDHEIHIDPSNYVDADSRTVNNFIDDFVSFNWNDNYLTQNRRDTFLDKKRQQGRNFSVRYGYMPTAKGTWVMFDTYLHTNPDSRPTRRNSEESRITKEIYDYFDSYFVNKRNQSRK